MIYKIANIQDEYNQIFKLNYATFVDEIPQHKENDEKTLIDKFHNKNIYIIAKKDNEVIAMISLNSNRPFSLDEKLGRIEDFYKKDFKNPVEIRLLSIKEEYRKTKAFFRLLECTFNYLIQHSYDLVFISGTTRQEKLYRHIGFNRFHDNVGTEGAEYIPMALDLRESNRVVDKLSKQKRINYLPGPVDLPDNVLSKFSKQLYSHRSKEFVSLTQDTLRKIKNILKVKNVTILHGSGTLANESILAQLAQRNLGKGVILANGEFGNRLVRQAKRHNLSYDSYVVNFGESFDLEKLRKDVIENNYKFIYVVHHETSVGILNNLDEIINIAKECGGDKDIVLAVDAISAVGAIKYDYSNVDYVACSSGKAFCSIAGLAIVGSNCDLVELEQETIYLDLKYANDLNSIPFTQPSLLIEALNVALDEFETDEPYNNVVSKYRYMRSKLEQLKLPIMEINSNELSPVILTVEVPKQYSSVNIGDSLSINNIFIHYNSSYLRERNILQFSFINRNTNFEEIDYTINIIKNMIGEI
ncbi:alanine--glyoxylate aminotransferase family protein [Gemella sp. GH3]|uniref:aminotransferase class V-fold PLP-dependent enzyme n=1 Tax=unclassified Gemella TaxID=2624949 RepID=UPI0015D03F6D|nr:MULTISPECIES: aminotransferase class V-fold PLP-dependent enzyme [unclassified Gemella]MBF0714305.1 alanine--glyoxylate aminotransferase family protein [Gemella sp. GH3.1]NYS51257.1 alanine--glyoxylate aminotransferase family protein [Gemella sp. GH3]